MRKNFSNQGLLSQPDGQPVNLSGCQTLQNSSPSLILGCLSLLDDDRPDSAGAIILDNPTQGNMMILLDKTVNRYYLGVDLRGSITAKGIFPAHRSKGNDHTILSERLVVILKTFDMITKFRNAIVEQSLPSLSDGDVPTGVEYTGPEQTIGLIMQCLNKLINNKP